MFARLPLILFTLPLLAIASAVLRTEPSQCNTGPVQCCNSVQKADAPGVQTLLMLLGIFGEKGLVGVTCSPIIPVVGAGSSCNAQPVCCTNNNFNGVVALGCTPININL